MKKTEKIFGLTLAVLFALALTACPTGGGGSTTTQKETPTARTSGTEKALSFGGKVTIKSDDKFTNAEWNTLCNKVVTEIETACVSSTAKGVFASDRNTTVVFGNSFTHNWEVKTDEYRTVYIKTASIDTVDFGMVIGYMSADTDGNG